MKQLIIAFLLFSVLKTFSQINQFLDSIHALKNKISPTEYVKTVNTIPYDEALKNGTYFLSLVKEAADIAEGLENKLILGDAYSKLALGYHFTSKPDLSVEYNLKAAQLFKSSGAIESFARCYLTLGWQIKNRDLKKGLNYMIKGIRILENFDENSENLKFGYNNYGVLKQRNNELDSALIYHEKALALSSKQKDSVSIPFALTHIAEVYMKQQQFAKAEAFFLEALELRKQRNDLYGITDSYLYLGDYYYQKGENDKAILQYEKGKDMARKYGYFPLEKYANEYLYQSYKKKKDYEKALLYFETFTKLKDSILNTNTNDRIAQLQVEFETSEKERKILSQNLELKKRNLILLYLGSALVITALLFFFIWKRNKLKRVQLKNEMKLKDELSQIKTKNKLQEQRLEISRDLHDNIGSQLTFIISSLDNLKYINRKLESSIEERVDEIGDFAKATIHQLRDTIWAMNKDEVSIDDLTVRLYSYIEKAKSIIPEKTLITSTTVESEASLPSNVGIQIFRIVQEALNNAIKYAAAKTIALGMAIEGNSLVISVSDDGKGFDRNTINLGNGLRNMQTRADKIGGQLTIESSINSGTTITLTYPLQPKN